MAGVTGTLNREVLQRIRQTRQPDIFMTAPTSHRQQSDSFSDEPVSDTQLMAVVKRGDKLAFSQLYDRHAGTVYGVCLRVLRRPVEAEAVVSDVFWEIWRKPEGFDPLRGSFRTYLLSLRWV